MATPRKAAAPAASKDDAAAASSSTASDRDRGSSVQVVVRMRPPSEKEKATNDTMVVGVYTQHSEVRVQTNFRKGPASATGGAAAAAPSALQAPKTYTFDKAYGATSTQLEVYTQAVEPLVQEVLQGFNCTGQ